MVSDGNDIEAISPVLGSLLMVVLTVLLASVILVMGPNVKGLEAEKEIERLEEKGGDRIESGNGGTGVAIRGDDRGGDEGGKTNEMRFHVSDGSDTAGNSLDSIEITYPNGFDTSKVDSRDDILELGIDGDGDGEIDSGRDATGDVECCPPDDGVKISNGGKTLTVETSGNYDLYEGDTIILRYRDVETSSNGDEVSINVNGDVTKNLPLTRRSPAIDIF